MTKVLELEAILTEDQLACAISRQYQQWENLREHRISEWQELQKYIFATDTTQTSNSKLPWSNKTTIPKMCQIRDNLHANYMATLFPKRKWLIWEGNSAIDEAVTKRKNIEQYMDWVIDRNIFYSEMSKLIYDYIDFGNVFVMPEWKDFRVEVKTPQSDAKMQMGYVGPALRRISPLDIVFNPAAPSFDESPKIIRSFISLGEVKELLERESITEEDKAGAEELFKYLNEVRYRVGDYKGNIKVKDTIYSISGFTNFRQYLQSYYCEILTFYGDMYDHDSGQFLRNHIIKVVDRHRVISKKPNPSYLGKAPIRHVSWRPRSDNLYGMGPLENLVGMQYRIDHLENMKADIFDLTAFPPLKIKGYVEDFDWGPFERIYVGDDGDVELMSPNVNALQADNQIATLMQIMEEMAGSPKEAMGFRTPGEKTAYEVQRLENAASRIFQNKTAQIERDLLEPALNDMLELARRNLDKATIRVFDDELKIAEFKDVTPEEIAGNGRLKPVAARHFAEKANQVQTLNAFYGSAAGQDPEVKLHFSSVQQAKMWESLLDLEPYNIVEPYIRIIEHADATRLQNSVQQQVGAEAQTPTGMGNDADPLPSDQQGPVTNDNSTPGTIQ